MRRLLLAHDGYSPYWNLSRRIQTCAADLDIVSYRGEIFFESEGNDYFAARRASATKWILYGDDFGVGAKRPRVGVVRREPGSNWWDIYRGSRVFGHARGRDGGAVGLALVGCGGDSNRSMPATPRRRARARPSCSCDP